MASEVRKGRGWSELEERRTITMEARVAQMLVLTCDFPATSEASKKVGWKGGLERAELGEVRCSKEHKFL